MSEGARAALASDGRRNGIPLDLGNVLTPYAQHRQLSLRVRQLPQLAGFSRGKRNDDRSWSLTPSDLEGLELLVAEGSEPPSSLTIDIVGIDESENASVIAQTEVPVVPASFAMKTDEKTGAAAPGPWRQRMERRVQAAFRLSRRRADEALADKETEWRSQSDERLSAQAQELEQTWQDKLQAERRAREAAELKSEETADELTALGQQLDSALAQAADAEAAKARSETELQRHAEASETRLAQELQDGLTAARTEWERDEAARTATAVQQAVEDAEDAAELRFRKAEAQWREETDREVEAARQQAVRPETNARDVDAELAAARAGWEAEHATGLREQAQQLEQTWQDKLELERNRRQAAEAEAEAARRDAARAQTETRDFDAELAAARTAWQLEHESDLREQAQQLEQTWQEKLELERSLRQAAEAEADATKARHEDELRRNRATLEARMAVDAQEQLAAARAEWEQDSAARIAGAVQQAVSENEAATAVRLQEAEARWREAAERDIEAARQQCVAAETAAQQTEQRFAAARDAWQAEIAARVAEQARELAQTVADSEAAAAARLQEAEMRWREAAQRDIEAARQQCALAESTAQQSRQDLEDAREAWQAESASRLEVQARNLEQAWQEKLEAERQGREEAEHGAEAAAQENADLSNRLAAAERSHAEALQQQTKDADAQLARELEAQLAAARADWEKESAAQNAAAVAQAVAEGEAAAEHRLDEARVLWQEQARRERAALQAELASRQAEAVETSGGAAEEMKARSDDLDQATAHDSEQNRAEWEEEAQERAAREAEAAVAKAEEKWRAEETRRLAAARADWKKKSKKEPKVTGSTARSLADQQRQGRFGRKLKRVALVAGGIAAAVALYTEFKPAVLDRWQPQTTALIDSIQSTARSKVQALSDIAKPRMNVAAATANVRAGPSTSTAVIARLPRNTTVTVIERRGNWILIQFGGEQKAQGWLHQSLISANPR